MRRFSRSGLFLRLYLIVEHPGWVAWGLLTRALNGAGEGADMEGTGRGREGEQLSTGWGMLPWGAGAGLTTPGYGGGGVRLTARSPLLGLAGWELGGVGGISTLGTTWEAALDGAGGGVKAGWGRGDLNCDWG